LKPTSWNSCTVMN